MKTILTILLAAAFLLPAKAALSATMIDRVVAVVGNDVITLSELQTEMAGQLSDMEQKLRGDDLAKATERLKRATLDSLVDKSLQLQEAKFEGVEVTDGEIDSAIEDIMTRNKMDKAAFEAALAGEGYTLADYRKQLSDQLAILRLVNRVVKSKVLLKEEDIKKYYEDNKARYSSPESVTVANIFFPANGGDMDAALKSAQAARAEIMAGTPFEDMAVKCTNDPKAAKTCVLGTFAKGELSSDIEGKAFGLSAGEISEPIKVDKGYQLIKVMNRTGEGSRTLEEARPEIVDQLTSKDSEAIFAKWIGELRKHTYVEIRE